jgi:transforming growth factor-beta-induced protein
MSPEARVSAYNMLGQKMIFEKSSTNDLNDEKITNEIKAKVGNSDEIVINEKAKILERDLMGTNGVVHIIDTLLETPTALPISTMLGTKNLTIFKKLMEYGSFADDFDNLENATYFIPTDEAFESSDAGKFWVKQLEESPAKLKNNENLKRFLDYHVIQPMTKSTELTERMLPTIEGKSLRVNLYSTLPGFTNVMNLGTINCARLIHFDQDSCGSVLHQVDKVLTAPNETVMEMLENNPNYSQFLKLVQKANLTSMLEEAEGKGYTLFVPRDEVFAEVDEWLKKKSEDELKDLIQNHIASDVTCCAGIIRSDWPFTYTIKTISQNSLTLNRDRRPKVQNAGVSRCDIIGTNGIIHEVRVEVKY